MWSELRRLKADTDYGTPPRDGAPVALEIDGVAVTVPAGSSVLLAATDRATYPLHRHGKLPNRLWLIGALTPHSHQLLQKMRKMTLI